MTASGQVYWAFFIVNHSTDMISLPTYTMTIRAMISTSTKHSFRIGKTITSQSLIHPAVICPVKRPIDILGAIVGLLLTGVLLLPIAIAIRWDSPGPIFYGQIRCGYRGKLFRLWKFRSMQINADAMKPAIANQASGHIFKNANDPRITRVGKFLRCTSLDELPQFWNVLQGDMSLVGTRPPTPDEAQYYSLRHWSRLEVKPGMTGEWQVYGRSLVKDFEAIVDLDLRYQQRWSIGHDIFLLWKTLQVVLNRQGAC